MRYQAIAISAPVSSANIKKICFWNIIFKGIILLMIAAPILYAIIQYMNAPQNIGKSIRYIQIPLSGLPEGKSQLVLYNGQPVIVINNHGNIKAISALCTMSNSVLHWDNEREELVCSTHGSRFDLNGNVTSGLAPRPLEQFKLMVGEDTIIIGGQL